MSLVRIPAGPLVTFSVRWYLTLLFLQIYNLSSDKEKNMTQGMYNDSRWVYEVIAAFLYQLTSPINVCDLPQMKIILWTDSDDF